MSSEMLRLMTCGSVDDGKSTLLGRLLWDAELITGDQRDQLASDSARSNNVGRDGLDYSLLLDGLEAEREQGITIDVAYRYFETGRRKFIIADTPGHEQYVRNMATAASTSELSLLVADARKGLLFQGRRHARIAEMFGIRRFIVAVNKMDLIDYDQGRFDEISSEFRDFLETIGVSDVVIIPVVARDGDNVARPSSAMPWYTAGTLLAHLQTASSAARARSSAFRFPVQWVNRADQDFRGYAGTVTSGRIAVGDSIAVLPAGTTSRVARIVTYDGDLSEAQIGTAVTLTLTEDLSVNRGDIIASASSRPGITDQFSATVIWFGDAPLIPERSYLFRFGPRSVSGQITRLHHRVSIDSSEPVAARHLDQNDMGVCHVAIDEPVPFDPYVESRETGSFIIIDRHTNATLGCGMIQFALRRAENLHWQGTKVDKAIRAKLKRQRPCVLWFTGLSGSGKSTIANLVETKLAAAGHHTYLLDGDNVRHGLSRDLGFTVEDRVENIRRVAECAKLFAEAGLIVLVALISPFREDRAMARRVLQEGEFLECFVNTPIEVCEQRDPKGLYKKAREGALPNFTGIDSPYEAPLNPELDLPTDTADADSLAETIVRYLHDRGYLL